MADPFDLALIVGDTRLGSDESNATRIPGDLTWTTNAIGGCTNLSCSLLREIRDDGPERLGDLVRAVYSSGGDDGWVGRLVGKPRTVSTWTQAQTAQAHGLWYSLEDNQAVRFLGIDRDLGKWQGPTVERQLEVLASPLRPTGPIVEGGNLTFDVTGTWTTAAGRPVVIAFYSASPLNVGRVMFSAAKTVGVGPASFAGQIIARAATGIAGPGTAVVNYITVAPSGTPATATQPGQNFAAMTPAVEINVFNPSISSSSEEKRTVSLEGLAVVGDHGLPLTGSSAADYGLKASDMIRYWIDTYAPRLTPGTIVDSGLGIQHFAPTDPTTVADLIANANSYHAWSVGVWGADTAGRGLVDFHPYGQGSAKTWIVRAGTQGVDLQQDGDNLTDLWTGIVVTFQTPDGKQLSVGPPGAQTHHTSSELVITDTAHPLVQSGDTRNYLFQLSVPTTLETAVAVGNVMLGQLNAARHTGTLGLSGMVEDDAGHLWPASRVRGGDSVRIVNQTDTTPRLIAEATYNHGARSVQCQLGTSLQTVEAIVAHLGARTTGRI